MPDASIHLFLTMAKLSSPDERINYTLQHPVLLSPAAQEQIGKRLAEISEDQAFKEVRDELIVLLDGLKQLRSEFESYQTPYPFGLGPLEQVWERELNGEISHDHAVQLANSEEITSLLSPAYIDALAMTGMRLAFDAETSKAQRLQDLLVAAVSSLPQTAEADSMQDAVAFSGLSIATKLLREVPDGRIYRGAQQFAEGVAKTLETADRRARLGEMLNMLGSLNVEPYIADRFIPISDGLLDEWMVKVRLHLGEAEYSKYRTSGKEDELRMPPPAEALRTGETCFRRSAALLDGHPKGLTLKALVWTLQWMRNQGEEIDTDELLRLTSEAATLIDPSMAPNEILFLMQIQVGYKQAVDRSVVDRLLATSLDDYIRRFGTNVTADLIQQSATILRGIDPARSLQIMRDARQFYEEHGTEDSRIFRWNHMLEMIKLTFAPDLPAKIPVDELKATAEHLLTRFQTEGWDIRKLCAGLIALSEDYHRPDDKGVALDLLSRVGELAPLFTKDYGDALQFRSGHVVNVMSVANVQIRAWPQAVRCQIAALRKWIELRLPGLTFNQLKTLSLILPGAREQAEVFDELINGFLGLALRIENLCPGSYHLLQEQYRQMAAEMASHFLKNSDVSEQFFAMIQLAKGLRFSTALLRGSRYDKLNDERGKQLLQEIEAAEAELAKQGQVATSEPLLIDEEMALMSYAQPEEFQYSGQTAGERLSNLQNEFDANVNLNLLSGIGEQVPPIFSIREIQDSLDERTVLVNYYLGLSEQHQFALWMFLLTRDQRMISWNVVTTPWTSVMVSKGGHRGIMNYAAPRIHKLRSAIQDTPESGFVSREAGVLLEKDLNSLLGPMLETLERLKAEGKDHLCVVPHGPYHYHPVHLIGKPGKPIADSWKVTYLPNLSLLVSPGGKPKVQRHRSQMLSVIGLSFEENSFGLDPIPESINECRKVAAVFGTEPIVEKDATEEAMISALQSSRYVHLSTHGRHNVVAPSFQSLYLTPDTNSDGRLYAHEIVSSDFSGLEVLTLSACETALGRFDVSDNLRGLPASFLLAGVKTIIGTLWPAAVDPSELFFSTFYRELKANRSRLDAFYVAQTETRARYPEYRDWGPFYLIGRWD